MKCMHFLKSSNFMINIKDFIYIFNDFFFFFLKSKFYSTTKFYALKTILNKSTLINICVLEINWNFIMGFFIRLRTIKWDLTNPVTFLKILLKKIHWCSFLSQDIYLSPKCKGYEKIINFVSWLQKLWKIMIFIHLSWNSSKKSTIWSNSTLCCSLNFSPTI